MSVAPLHQSPNHEVSRFWTSGLPSYHRTSAMNFSNQKCLTLQTLKGLVILIIDPQNVMKERQEFEFANILLER